MLRNIATAYPQMSDAEREKLAHDVWRNLGRVAGEFFHLDEIVRDRIEVENPEVLRAVVASGKGAVICGAHQANWEGAGGALAGFGLKPLSVYRAMSNPLVDDESRRSRLKYYPGGLVEKRDQETPLVMMRHARAGGSLAFLVDQMMYMGLETPFFGLPAKSTPFPALVARQCNIPLLVITGCRKPGVRFSMKITPLDVPRTDDRDADIYAATAAMQAELEKSIRLHPEQWMWVHNRWF